MNSSNGFIGNGKFLKQKLLLLLWVSFIPFLSLGQSTPATTITGTVKDQKGIPLPGVGIRVKGSGATGTSTDANGRYSIGIPSRAAVLVFSYIGFLTAELSPGAQNVLNVTLTESQKGLDEVVVIGYGQVARPDLTGAVGSVNMKDFQKAPVRSFEEALAGRLAGVQV